MNKAFLALFLLSFSFAQTYTVDVDRAGASSVILSLEGGGEVNVTMPTDAQNIRIVGGSYSISDGTASIRTGQSGFATFSFSSALLTSKADGRWRLSFIPPAGSDVRVYMPAYAAIENSFPQPMSVSSEDSRTWLDYGPANAVNVYYTLQEPPQTQDNTGQIYLAAALILASAAIISSFILRGAQKPSAPPASKPPAERQPTLEITPGKSEMMETFNENDKKIADHLLACGGRCRRNELEKKTGISKSSLSMALNRLEKRKIVELDRTSTTHSVKLSDFFLRL